MSETTLLLVIMGGLALIEIGLIVSIQQLKKTLESMNEKVKKFEGLVGAMGLNIANIYGKFQSFSNGELKVKGSTPVGSVDLSLQLGQAQTQENPKK